MLLTVTVTNFDLLEQNLSATLFYRKVKEPNIVFQTCISVSRGIVSKVVFVSFVHTGVAVGGGWQGLVAYINLACYYIFGLPLGFLLGYKLNLGVEVISNLWHFH